MAPSQDEIVAPANIIDACTAALQGGVSSATQPEVLYHLTDLSALTSILSTSTLWASLATSLNDSLEVEYGLGLAQELLQDRLRHSVTEYDSALLGFLLDPSAAPPSLQIQTAAFVVSLCASVDQSGQWLHYGRQGRGFAIGFSPAIASAVSYDLVRVDYERASQRKRMLSLIEVGATALSSAPSASVQDERRTAHIVSLFIPQLAGRMKHPSFACEDEWRLVGIGTTLDGNKLEAPGHLRPTRFRTSGERLVPYEELDFSTSARSLIREVVIGHASSVSIDAVRLLAVEHKLNPRVSRSPVPVR